MALRSILQGSAGVLSIAGSFSGVPYASAGATLLSGIIDTTQQIVVHKRKCISLSDKAKALMLTLEDQGSRLVGTELQQAVDEVFHVLERVNKRTRRFSEFNKVTAFFRLSEIEKGLDKCEADLDSAMSMFNVNTNVVIHYTQLETQSQLRSDTDATHELLYQILTSHEELKRAIQMQQNGEHVAERLMEAGQMELREMREGGIDSEQQVDDLMVADRMTSFSPPPILPQLQDSQKYLEYQRGLIELQKATGIPPTVKTLDGEVTKVGDLAVTGGTYSDVWEGRWLGNKKVALKALRNIKATDTKAQRRFEHEIKVWAKLEHSHILSFYGIVTEWGQIHMVSPWQENGNVLEYVKINPSANKIRLMVGASEGIAYLHSRKIVHGNLKCANILVSADDEAVVCDFGMSAVIEEVTEKSASATLTAAGSVRWLAPEIILNGDAPTFAADTYSFAMAMLELLTGKHPYFHRKRDASVIHDIVFLKKMPPRPLVVDITDDLWTLMQDCWCSDASGRPTMDDIAARMEVVDLDMGEVEYLDAMDTV